MNSDKYIKALERDVSNNPWLTEQERAELWMTLETVGSDELDDNTEYETIKNQYIVPMYMDEDKVHNRGYNNNEIEVAACRWDDMIDEDKELMDIDVLDTMENAHQYYLDDDNMFVAGNEIEKWNAVDKYFYMDDEVLTAAEYDWAVESEFWRPIEYRQVARVEKGMGPQAKKATWKAFKAEHKHLKAKAFIKKLDKAIGYVPGLPYHLSGGKKCMDAIGVYRAMEKEIGPRLTVGKALYLTAYRERDDGFMNEIQGCGQELKRDLNYALVRVKAVHKFFGKTYDPDTYYKHKKKIKKLKDMPKEWYELTSRDYNRQDKWTKMSQGKRNNLLDRDRFNTLNWLFEHNSIIR